MTVADLMARLTISEENDWLEYHTILGEEHRAAMAAAKAQRSGG